MARRPRRTATAVAVALSIFIVLLAALGRVQAGPPPEPRQFRWVEGIDNIEPGDGPERFSRPLTADWPPPAPEARSGVGLHDLGNFSAYPTPTEIVTAVHDLAAAYPDLVTVYELGRSWQDRPIVGVRLGSSTEGDPDARPAFYLDGQHHAREAISAQVVLYFLAQLAASYGDDPLITHLLDTRTVYAIPSVNPDGNAIFLDIDQNQRKTANPTSSDDDGDGRFDEDPPEGFGYGSFDLYVYEFDAAWVDSHASDPFVDGWAEHVVTTTQVGVADAAGNLVAQVDNDGDDRVNEDGYGGVDANRNYASHWEAGNAHPAAEVYRGPEPFSEPDTRAVRDFVEAHANIVLASSYHSGSDVLLHPWGWTQDGPLPDSFWFERLSRKGSQLTQRDGFQGAPHTWTARGLYPGAGSTMDWLYERGILAWTPEVYRGSSLGLVERIGSTNRYTTGVSTGVGFNPPPAEIGLTADRWLQWNLYQLAATPDVGLAGVAASGGELRLVVSNDGVIPLNIEATIRLDAGTTSFTLAHMRNGVRTLTLPLPASAATHTVAITLTGAADVAIGPGPLQVERVDLEIAGATVLVVGGQLTPYQDLGPGFGGWFAADAWDGDQYHRGPRLLYEQFMPFIRTTPHAPLNNFVTELIPKSVPWTGTRP